MHGQPNIKICKLEFTFLNVQVLTNIGGEIVRSYAKFDVTFFRCVELRSTAWFIKAIIGCSTFSHLSSEHRRLLSW